MPDLGFQIKQAQAVPYSVAPLLMFKLLVTSPDPEQTIHTVALRCQIQIEVTRRHYTAEDQERLRDLFGEPARWSQTLRNLLWTHASVVIPPFQGSTVVDLPVPCTFDFNVATTKYFSGLSEGEIPLLFQFSGTIFYANSEGSLQVVPISWDKETRFKLPVKNWSAMMDAYYPNSAWLCLRRDIFDRLHRHKIENGIPTWEQAIESVLPTTEEEVRS